jgi:hypothetical protein
MLDNGPMHIVIPYAAPLGPQCQAALAQLQLPVLAALLELLQPTPPLLGTETSLTPLAERVQAKCVGLTGADGLVPWAALDAEHLGLRRVHGETGWAWITPCHWQVNADHVALDDPRELDLAAAESDALREAMQAYFAEDGIQLHPLSNSTWLAQGPVLAEFPTASLERVRGGTVDAWMPSGAGAQTLRRLQNEMQMLLYTHPVNDARVQRGLLPVNSFWISGTGPLEALPAAQSGSQAELIQTLAAPAQRDDPYAWSQAWSALDATTLTDLLRRAKANESVQLTLCGERMATTFELQSSPWWNRLQRRFTTPPLAEFLQAL